MTLLFELLSSGKGRGDDPCGRVAGGRARVILDEDRIRLSFRRGRVPAKGSGRSIAPLQRETEFQSPENRMSAQVTLG